MSIESLIASIAESVIGKIKENNPYHQPAGSSIGGQFAPAPNDIGGGGSVSKSKYRTSFKTQADFRNILRVFPKISRSKFLGR